MATTIVSNSTAATFGNSPQKTGEPVDRLSIYSGKALEFDGVTDYLKGDAVALDIGSGECTFTAWVKFDDVSASSNIGFIVNNTTDSNNRAILMKDDSKVVFGVIHDGSHSAIGSSAVIADKWYRIVGTNTSTTVKIYLDGVEHDVATATSSAYNNVSYTVGASAAPASYLGCKICDVQIWNKKWELSDVTYDYLNPENLITDNTNVTSDITTSNLLLWLPMNDTGITTPQTVVFDGANSGGLTSNYVSSSSFDSDSGWSLGTNWSISGGKLIGSANTANGNLTGLGFEENFTYKVVYSITSYTSGEVRVTVAGGQSGTYRSGVGTYTEYLPAGSSSNLTFRGNPSSAFTGEIDDLTVQKVKQGYHATTTFFGDDKLGGNGGFDATSNWTVVSGSVGTEWTINDSSNSKAVHNTSNANTLRYTGSSGDLVDGTTYQVDFTIADRTAGSITIAIGGAAASSSQTASGSIELTAGGSSNRIIDINPTSDFDGSIDSVTVREVGIATGWTDVGQQQTIPQTAFMDGCVKIFSPTATSTAHYVLDSTGTTASGTAYSVSAWVMRTVEPSATDVYLISGPSSADDYINFKSPTQVGWDTSAVGSETYDLGITIPGNVWDFWTFVSDGGTKRIYRNAIQLVTNSVSPSSGLDYSIIGKRAGVANMDMEGIIDELAIWDTVLSPTEVTELYNNGLPLNATKHSKYITSASNLKAYWKNNHLNSEGKMKDQVGSNHATITNPASFKNIFFQQGVTANLCTQGYSNNIVHPSKGSIHFLGQEYAQFPGERIINLDGDFTIEFWFKKTQIHGAELTDGMLFRSGNNQIRIPTGVSSGKMSGLKYRDASSGSVGITIHSDNRKSIYEWSHIAFVRESGTLKIYIDTATTGNDTLSTTGQMQISLIGAYSISAGQVYKGFLDDLRVYDKALSAAEVAKNYKHGKSQHKNS